MHKKGFTLVELIAVIVILSLLVSIGIPAFINVRNNILEKQYLNVVSRIENAALKYANDTQILVLNVEELIKNGYISPDDETDIYDPRNKKSLNCNIIKIEIDNKVYKAVFTNETYEKDGICQINNQKIANLIVASCENDENLEKCQFAQEKTNGEWFSGSVRLSTSDKLSVEEKNLVEWIGLNGQTGKGESIKVTSNDILKTSYRLLLTTEKRTLDESKFIQIDNEKPIIYGLDYDKSFSNKDIKIKINASDKNGSGIYEYAISTDKNMNFKTENDFTLGNGSYYAQVKDKAGNFSEFYNFEITNVDEDAPYIKSSFATYSSKKENGATYYQELTRKVVFSDDKSGVSSVNYCLTTLNSCEPIKPAQMITDNGEETALLSFDSDNKDAQKVCVRAIDKVGNSSEIICDTDKFLVDHTAPDSSSISYSDKLPNILSVDGFDKESGINKYVCNYGTSKTNLNKTVTAKNKQCDIGNLSTGTYYAQVKTYNNAGLFTASKVIQFEIKSANIKDAYNKICGSNEYCAEPFYVDYNGHLFVVYRNTSEGYKAIYDSVWGSPLKYRNSAKCAYLSYSDSPVAETLNSTFLNSLPKYQEKLVLYTKWDSSSPHSTIGEGDSYEKNYIGLLSVFEYNRTHSINRYMYEDALGHVYWTLNPFIRWRQFPRDDQFVCLTNEGQDTSMYTYIFAVKEDGDIYGKWSHALGDLRPVIVLNPNIEFTGGDGSKANPYTVL